MRAGIAIKRFPKRYDWPPPDNLAGRESQALTLIDKYAPGLAPAPWPRIWLRPIRRDHVAPAGNCSRGSR